MTNEIPEVNFTFLELRAIYMALDNLIDLGSTQSDGRFNQHAIEQAQDIVNNAKSARAKLEEATKISEPPIQPYIPGDELPFINLNKN